jgi:methionyl aminopeptidase
MALIKTAEEIELMRQGGALLSRAMEQAVLSVAPGVRVSEIDEIAEKVIRDGGGEPSFKGYKSSPFDTPFPSTVCVSINEEVVHGLGDRDRVLVRGDIVGLDMGCWYKGMCTDMAVTVPVGEVDQEEEKLMKITKEALVKGIAAAKVGNNLSDISRAIEEEVKPHGFGIVQTLGGHGVGHEVHEQPFIPNFVNNQFEDMSLLEGMCLALEPMVGLGECHTQTAEDGWAIQMKDGKKSAHYEVTIALTDQGAEILTPLPLV